MKFVPLVIVLVASLCFQKFNCLAIEPTVIDFWEDIENHGWNQIGALYNETGCDLPDYADPIIKGISGKGIWYWIGSDDWAKESQRIIEFYSAPTTYEQAKSITLNITYFARFAAESNVTVEQVSCESNLECNKLKKYNLTEGSVWYNLFVEIDVQMSTSIRFDVTLEAGDWLLFDKIEINATYDTSETEPPTTTEEPTTKTTQIVTTMDSGETSSVASSSTTDATLETMETSSMTSSTEESQHSTSPASVDDDEEEPSKGIPFYKTWWFIAICISIGLTILLLAIDSQRRRCGNCCRKAMKDEGDGVIINVQKPGERVYANSDPTAAVSESKKGIFAKKKDQEYSKKLGIYFIPRPKLTQAHASTSSAGNQ